MTVFEYFDGQTTEDIWWYIVNRVEEAVGRDVDWTYSGYDLSVVEDDEFEAVYHIYTAVEDYYVDIDSTTKMSDIEDFIAAMVEVVEAE